MSFLLVSQHFNIACGVAYRGVYNYPSWAYGLIMHNCYHITPGHELAHMFGACHDRENSANCVPEDGTAYGYWIRGTDARTIMR